MSPICGTEAKSSSPDTAGTGAWLTGSFFMAIVPPVASSTQVGMSAAGLADAIIRQAKPKAGRITLVQERLVISVWDPFDGPFVQTPNSSLRRAASLSRGPYGANLRASWS